MNKKAKLFSQLANQYERINDIEQSEVWMARAQNEANATAAEEGSDEIKGHLANELASMNRFDDAICVMKEIESLEIACKTVWKLANKMGKSGEKERAQVLLDTIAGNIRLLDASAMKAELLTGTGANYRHVDASLGLPYVYEAYGIVQMISDLNDKAILLNEIGANLVDIGHMDQAKYVFVQASQTAELLEDPLAKARALAMLGGEMAEKGLRDEAPEVLERGLAAASLVSEGEEKWDVISEIARNFGQSYRFERGIEVSEMLESAYYRIEGFIRIAKNMARLKQIDQAVQLLERSEIEAATIVDTYRFGTISRKIASEYISLKQPERARTQLDRIAALFAVSANV